MAQVARETEVSSADELDDPPVIIRGSFRKSFWAFGWPLLPAIFIGLDGLTKAPGWVMFGELSIGLIGLLIAGSLVRGAVRPNLLVLEPSGLSYRALARTMHFRWDEVSTFRLIPSKPLGLIGFDQQSCRPAGRLNGVLGRFNRRFMGVEGGFPATWERDSAGVVELLNAARQRWRTRGPA